MHTEFKEWLFSMPKKEVIYDIISQLLAHITKNSAPLSPDNFYIDFAEENEFGELVFSGNSEKYHEDFYPESSESTEKGNVFVAGLLLYTMITGEKPNLEKLDFMSVAINLNGDFPFLSCPESSMNNLVETMTNANPDTRATAEKILDIIAETFKGTAVIKLTESDSDSVIEKINIPLEKGITEWKPLNEYEINGQKFFPQNNTAIKIPYRQKISEYSLIVNARKEKGFINCNIKSDSDKKYFGVDLGEHNIRISVLDKSGKITDLFSKFPSVAAYNEKGVCLFGKDAEQLCNETKAEPIYFLKEDFSVKKQINTVDETGNAKQIYADEIVKNFFEYLVSILSELYNYSAENAFVSFALSENCNVKYKSELLKKAQECGINAVCCSSITAAALSYHAENKSNEKIIIINAGGKSTDIGIFNESVIISDVNQINSDILQPTVKSVIGGNDMTDVLFEIIIRKINTEYNLNMFNYENSGLSSTRYLHNKKIISAIAEKIKIKLSFNDIISEKCELFYGASDKISVSVTVKKEEFENLLREKFKDFNNTVEQLIKSKKCQKMNIESVILSGGAISQPAFAKHILSYFNNVTDIKRIYDSTFISRGAAIFAYISENSEEKTLSVLDKDIGIITMDASRGVPVFSQKIPSDTPFKDDKVSFSYDYIIHKDEKDAERGELKIYTREKGMEHILSTYDGNAIKYIGKICFEIPADFNIEKEKIQINVSVDNEWNVSAEIVCLKKAGFLSNIFSKGNAEWKNSDRNITSKFYGG